MTAIPVRGLGEVARAPRALGTWVLLVLITGAALVSRVGFLGRPFESDSGLYVYMGKVVADGGKLYRDFYETKPPGVGMFTAGLYWCFGDRWWAYVLLQAGMTLVGALVLSKAAGRVLGARGVVPVFGFAVVFLNFSPVAYRGFQLETVQCFFACLAGAFALWGLGESATEGTRSTNFGRMWFCVLAGFLAGVAGMLKPTGAGVAGALVIALMFCGRGRRRNILAVVAGLGVAPVLVLVWTWRAGLLSEMGPLFREISLYGKGTPIVAADWIKPAMALVVAGFPFLIVRICRTGAVPVAVEGSKTRETFLWFVVSWLVLEVAGVVLQRRMYIYHFLPVGVPLALLFGWACLDRRRNLYALALTPILIISLVHSWGDFELLLRPGSGRLPESDYLMAHASAGDLVVGDPLERVLMETGLKCGARYAHLFYFVNHDEAPVEFGGRFIEDLERNRPKWAVFRTDRKSHRLMQCVGQPMLAENPRRRENFLKAWRRIDDYLAEHYEAVEEAGEMMIFRRREH